MEISGAMNTENSEMIDNTVFNSENIEVAQLVLAEIFRKRRMLSGESEKEAKPKEEALPHLKNILHYINNNEPIVMILPAFPTKSPNRDKTLSHLPDFSEKYALKNLTDLCERIKKVYAPGAKVTICSDGRVFADLICVPDDQVSEYGKSLRDYAEQHHKGIIDFFDLDDIYTEVGNYDTLREELMIAYGEPLADLRQRCKDKKEASSMYKGITRFIFEDYLGIEPFKSQSRTSVQKEARIVAYRVIQRSNAWSRLLKNYYPNAVRLSIHPQYRVAEKIGVFLVESDDCWTTPWHSVAVKEGDNVRLVPRHLAEKMPGVALVYSNGRPSHFECLSN